MKPTVIIGLTGFGKIFTPEILEEMGKNNDRPVIFAMSNPTSRQECTAEEAQKYTGVPYTLMRSIMSPCRLLNWPLTWGIDQYDLNAYGAFLPCNPTVQS